MADSNWNATSTTHNRLDVRHSTHLRLVKPRRSRSALGHSDGGKYCEAVAVHLTGGVWRAAIACLGVYRPVGVRGPGRRKGAGETRPGSLEDQQKIPERKL